MNLQVSDIEEGKPTNYQSYHKLHVQGTCQVHQILCLPNHSFYCFHNTHQALAMQCLGSKQVSVVFCFSVLKMFSTAVEP